VTYRIALAIFTRSPAAYEALKGYQILNLPSVASLKQFTSANKQVPGLNLPRLHDAALHTRTYFSSGKGLECKFIMSCLMTTIQAFHIYGFNTIAVVCDGASANLKAIKYLTMGKTGAYGINEDPQVDDPHHVKTWMLNPWTNEKLFFILCPSHQVLTNLCRISLCNFKELACISTIGDISFPPFKL